MRRASLLLLMLLGAAEAGAEVTAKIDLEALAPPTDKAGYARWIGEQAPAVRTAIAKRCATMIWSDPLCNGIGPYGLDDPPPQAEEGERAQWEATLSPEARAWVAKMCAGPKNLTKSLCGYDLPHAPNAGEKYAAWYKRLSRRERGMVDGHCEELAIGSDEYCDGIGPLHIPSPPSRGRAMTRAIPEQQRAIEMATEQKAWDAWYAKLTKKQRAYYEYWCTAERGGVSELCGGTPLLIVLDGAPVAYTPAREESRFAIDGLSALRTDWPTARTPWIARDLDGDGVIADGRELFGSGTVLPDGQRARDGFVALAVLDDNADGVIDARDRAWSELLAWSDRDGDRRGQGAELAPLSSLVESISLRPEPGARCDDRGNCERLRANASLRGARGTGAVVDVQLLVQPPAR